MDPSKNAQTNQPQTWNRYTYARSNPLKCVDPDGRDIAVAGSDHKEAVIDILVEGVRRPSARAQLTILARDKNFKVVYDDQRLTSIPDVGRALLRQRIAGKRQSVHTADTAPQGGLPPYRTGALVAFDTLAIKLLHSDPSGLYTLGHEHEHVLILEIKSDVVSWSWVIRWDMRPRREGLLELAFARCSCESR